MTLSGSDIQRLYGVRDIRRRLADVTWAAGLFEGEGTCCLIKSQYDRPLVEISSSDRDVIERFASIIGFGSIRERKPRQSQHKSSWSWHVNSKNDVTEVLTLLLPHLGERRTREAQVVLERTSRMKFHLNKQKRGRT